MGWLIWIIRYLFQTPEGVALLLGTIFGAIKGLDGMKKDRIKRILDIALGVFNAIEQRCKGQGDIVKQEQFMGEFRARYRGVYGDNPPDSIESMVRGAVEEWVRKQNEGRK